VGFVEKVILGRFLRVLWFPLPILIPPTAPHSLSSVAGTIRQSVADIPSGLSIAQSQEIKKNALKTVNEFPQIYQIFVTFRLKIVIQIKAYIQ
jgi:hypothetical protein